MQATRLLSAVAVLALSVTLAAQPTVTLTLESDADGQTISAGAPINWTIKVGVSTGDNFGLAQIGCDLVQDAGNPAFLDIPPGDVASIDTTMQNFSRPAGIANPGEGGATTGYIGVQRGADGSKNLIQTGGAQNTFGQALPPGTGIGESANLIAGVGQGAEPQVVLSGTFAAPGTAGAYTYSLQNAIANVLSAVNEPPAHSPVVQATVDTTGGSITFTVTVYGLGDMNCDGIVNAYDIDGFICAVSPGCDYDAMYPDCDRMLADINGDGEVNAYDIDGFIDLVGGGG